MARSLNAHPSRSDGESETFVVGSFQQNSMDGRGTLGWNDGENALRPIKPQSDHQFVVTHSLRADGLDAGDLAPTLRAMPHDGSHANAGGQVAVAFHENQRAELTLSDTAGSLKVGGGKPGQGYPSVLTTRGKTRYHAHHANADEADTVALLRALREAVGAEAFEEWGLGVLASLWPQEILRPALHGVGFRCPPIAKSGLVNCALAFAKGCPEGAVRALWSAGCDGRPSPRWQPSEQLARELGAALSELPYAPSSACRFMSYLRQADEGSRLVRQALSAVEEARRSAASKTEPAHGSAQVRRLTVEECEALQGFPRTFTAISYRGKPAADGPRYRALGNSMAVPVVRWILSRIEACDAAMLPERAAA